MASKQHFSGGNHAWATILGRGSRQGIRQNMVSKQHFSGETHALGREGRQGLRQKPFESTV